MKLYQVSYNEDGRTIKASGVTETEIRRCDLFFAAESIEKVWEATQWVRDDEEKEFIHVGEVCSSIQVLK